MGGGIGFAQGLVGTGTLEGALSGAWSGAKSGAMWGAAGGAVIGLANPMFCFTAGTQVVVGLEIEDAHGRRHTARTPQELARLQLAHLNVQGRPELALGGLVTALKITGHLTRAIEELSPGDHVLTRSELDPAAPLVLAPLAEVFRNRSTSLLHVTLRSSNGAVQTLETTAEHPVFAAGRGWLDAGSLEPGDQIEDLTGTSTVLAVQSEPRPEGVALFNCRVPEGHTYFVRAADAVDAVPVWVHNAYNVRGPKTDNRFGHNRMIRQVAREVTAKGEKVIAGGRAFNGKPLKEAYFETVGGFKGARRPDILVRRPDGTLYGINVGKVDAAGRPVLRDRQAIQDLNELADIEMQFRPYGRIR